ncbi:MAG: ABC transporter ATP-binding protein [Thermodesulfobacteriota bacterium]
MGLALELKKSFDDFSIDVSLSLRDDLLVLFGPSGAGKSLILKMISGITAPDSGRVRVGTEAMYDSGAGVNVPIRGRRIGFLFQDYALFPHMTVHDNIAYGITHLPGDEVRRKVAELLGVMRLAGLDGRYPHELSGGQKQRCALARTLATNPRILLLDEPFSALDYQVREKLRADLLNIHRLYPITTILVTHDLEEAFMLGQRIAVINNGRIEQIGGREEVFYRPATRNVARFMGVRNIFSGRVTAVDPPFVTVHNRDLGEIKAHLPQGGAPMAAGSQVSFCIRPEEILVIRPDRVLDNRVQDNIIEGEITSATGRGSTQILFLRVYTGAGGVGGAGWGGGAGGAQGEGTSLKIELPNFVCRKLALATGKRIRVSLKKENVWLIP